MISIKNDSGFIVNYNKLTLREVNNNKLTVNKIEDKNLLYYLTKQTLKESKLYISESEYDKILEAGYNLKFEIIFQ